VPEVVQALAEYIVEKRDTWQDELVSVTGGGLEMAYKEMKLQGPVVVAGDDPSKGLDVLLQHRHLVARDTPYILCTLYLLHGVVPSLTHVLACNGGSTLFCDGLAVAREHDSWLGRKRGLHQ